eukprot:15214689-Alexandrium_andersonii.AAC.1
MPIATAQHPKRMSCRLSPPKQGAWIPNSERIGWSGRLARSTRSGSRNGRVIAAIEVVKAVETAGA